MEIVLMVVMAVLGLGLMYAVRGLGNAVVSRTRARGARRTQSRRHFVKAAQLLARSRSAGSVGAGRKLAQGVVAEADAAIALDPKDAALHIVKALGLEQMGRSAAALRSLSTALARPASRSLSSSEKAEALAKRAGLLLEQSKGKRGMEAAISDMEDSLALCSDNVKVQCMLAACYEKTGEKVKAIEAYQKALVWIPIQEMPNRVPPGCSHNLPAGTERSCWGAER